jgi:hypothetical protein
MIFLKKIFYQNRKVKYKFHAASIGIAFPRVLKYNDPEQTGHPAVFIE